MNNMPVNSTAKIQKEIRDISDLLVSKVNPYMVVLFGSHARGDWVSDSYIQDNVLYDYHSDYDILVVVSTNEIKNDITLWNDIQKQIHKLTSVSINLVVDTPDFIHKQLQESNYFYVDIKKEGVVLYDTGDFSFNNPLGAIGIGKKPKRTKEMIQKELDFWESKAKLFYIDYIHNIKDKSYNNAAFHLSQVTESLYFAVLVVITGYKPKAHNIDRLVYLVNQITKDLLDIFETDVLKEKKAFELLKRAYIDARYKKDYSIDKEDLDYLERRVNILFDKALKICRDFIQDYK